MSTNLIPSENLETVENEVVSTDSSVRVSVCLVETQSEQVQDSVGELDNTVERSTSDLVVGENFNEEVVQCKDKGRRIGIEVRKTELSSMIKEILVEQAVVMEKLEQEGVEQVVGGNSGAVLDGGNGNKESGGLVEGEEMVSSSIQENQNDGASVALEVEPDSIGVTESMGKPEVQVTGVNSVEDEEQKGVQVNGNVNHPNLEADMPENIIAQVSETERIDSHTIIENLDEGVRVTIDSSSVTITETVVEQVQVVEGGEVAMMDCEELLEKREVVPATNTFAGSPSSLENYQSVEAQAVGGIESQSDVALADEDLASDAFKTEENGSVEGQNTGIEIVEGGVSTVQTERQIPENQVVAGDKDVALHSTANTNRCHEDETSTQDGKQDTVALVDEPVSHQVDGVANMDSCPVDDGVHATEDPSSLPDESKHTDSGRVIETHVLRDEMLPDESQENGAEINEMHDDMDFSVLVLDEEITNDNMDVDNFEGNNNEIGDNFAGLEQRKSMRQQLVKPEALKPEPTARYKLIPAEKEGEFSISDLVWGKVRSHPWWPGQIFDPSDASEQAMKYHKKDSFLVAYFGDQSFAWNEASAMKSFCTHFSQMERQNSTEAFRIAVDSALDEIHRRVEFGMACSSTPEDICSEVKYQNIKNPGIREEARTRDGLDKNLSGISFQPVHLVRYIKELALNPCGGGDRLELVIARAQLLAFYRTKGICRLPEFHVFEDGLLECDDFDVISREKERAEKLVKVEQRIRQSQSRKRKHNPENGAHPNNRKEKSLSDLMTTKKPDTDDRNHADVDSAAPQSFKVGECIRRISSQLTGGPPILKGGSENLQDKGVAFLKEYSCPDMLSKLRLAARDHKKGHIVLTVIGGFFSEFRNFIILNSAGSVKQRKKSEQMVGSAETFDFEDTNDSYWTDRIVRNTSDEQAAGKNAEGKEETDLEANPTQKDNVSQAPGNSCQLAVPKELHAAGKKEPTPSIRKNRKRKGNNDQENPIGSSESGPSTKKPSSRGSRKKKEPPLALTDNNVNQLSDVQEKKGPTALLLKFTEPYSVPSVTNLNKTFRRFGPLKESETQVVKDSNSAVVVFKVYNDAEVAISSAGKFSIFGPAVVSYELSCFPLPPPKVPVCDSTKEASLCDTTPGSENVKVLEAAPFCDTTQSSHGVLEEAPFFDAMQSSHDVLEEAPLYDTMQGSNDVELLEGNTT
ncbi:uncharacterized protein LOC113322385 isoform X2 [Papaver somniferum]|uniref:uncharacterized protein LOC113322385 isoform X2 n=1 Tax=Papaver somniferum TaxID=3469 RepID=UPI000E6FB2AE|nr:uncharacterized protein LOC113322385 isoform X2 [Papaver somniferum]